MPCESNRTNAGGDYAPLNTTECDEVYTLELNDTYVNCTVSENCGIDVALTFAPLQNVTAKFFTTTTTTASSATRRRKLNGADAIELDSVSSELFFTPKNFAEPQKVWFGVKDKGLCAEATVDTPFAATTVRGINMVTMIMLCC